MTAVVGGAEQALAIVDGVEPVVEEVAVEVAVEETEASAAAGDLILEEGVIEAVAVVDAELEGRSMC